MNYQKVKAKEHEKWQRHTAFQQSHLSKLKISFFRTTDNKFHFLNEWMKIVEGLKLSMLVPPHVCTSHLKHYFLRFSFLSAFKTFYLPIKFMIYVHISGSICKINSWNNNSFKNPIIIIISPSTYNTSDHHGRITTQEEHLLLPLFSVTSHYPYPCHEHHKPKTDLSAQPQLQNSFSITATRRTQ